MARRIIQPDQRVKYYLRTATVWTRNGPRNSDSPVSVISARKGAVNLTDLFYQGRARLPLVNLSLAKSQGMDLPENETLAAGARLLARRLSEYSESSVAACWLSELEFIVWQDLVDRRFIEDLLVSSEGQVLPPLDKAEKEEFLQLAKAIGGWVVFDPEDADDRAAFVPFADWTARFELWLAKSRQAQQPDSR